MSQAMHIPKTRLADMSEVSLRQIAKDLAGQFHIPSVDEAKEGLEDFFSQLNQRATRKGGSLLSDEDKAMFAYFDQNFARRINECHDELGGTTYLYEDGGRVRVTSDMSEAQIYQAFKKAKNQKKK